MVFNFLRGQLIDVIEWLDNTRDTMVWRFERYDNAIQYGAKLTVREGQAAAFVHEGQLADVFSPGLYKLETNNLPLLTALQHWHHGFNSPFKSEVYFFNTRRFTGLKWGTKNPVMLRDPEFGPVRVRAFGSYAIRIEDPARFLREVVGTDGRFTQDEVSEQIRNIVVQKCSKVLAASGIPVLDMAANTKDLSEIVAKAIAPTLGEYGLSMPELYIENISLPEAVEKALDKRTSMGVIGDLNKYTQFSAAEAMTAAASTPDSGMGAGMGMGMGMGMAAQMAQAMGAGGPWGAAPAAPAAPAAAAATPPPPPPPPPPPTEVQWHIAANGQTQGPFTPSQLGPMITRGEFTQATLVWTTGQNGWIKAEEVPDLARLFTQVPPPPPPGI